MGSKKKKAHSGGGDEDEFMIRNSIVVVDSLRLWLCSFLPTCVGGNVSYIVGLQYAH